MTKYQVSIKVCNVVTSYDLRVTTSQSILTKSQDP